VFRDILSLVVAEKQLCTSVHPAYRCASRHGPQHFDQDACDARSTRGRLGRRRFRGTARVGPIL